MKIYRIVLLALCYVATMSAAAARVTYTADNTTIFRNPERGFTNETSRKVTTSKPNVLKGYMSTSTLNSGEYTKMSMLVVLYNFYYFKDKYLPEEVLAGFDEDMQFLRENGWKCVLRFAYTEDEDDIVDATPDWVERHLTQLKPHLAKNADVIYVLEAGFVGVWGEWYYTKNYGNESQRMNANRRRVIDALFASTPEDMFVLVRYPLLKQEYLGDSKILTSEEAFTGTIRARMGHHNDAFLNVYGDMGTYASTKSGDDSEMRQFIAEETLYLPNGGETNIEDANVAATRATYDKTIDAMSKYHWSFCGSTYAAAATGKWRREGTFDEINRRMGYRYQLVESVISDSVAPQGKGNVTIRICNVGFAPIYNERHAYLVLKNGSEKYSLPLKADPRRWLPNSEISTINEQVEIPASIPQGKYKLYLHLPDAHSSIAAETKYAVRFANEGIWDESTGMNDLKTTITVTSKAPLDPGELPEITSLDELQAGTAAADNTMYDILGKQVNSDYKGIVIQKGKKKYCVKY